MTSSGPRDVGSLEEESKNRKKRLEELKKKREQTSKDPSDENTKKLTFRSYVSDSIKAIESENTMDIEKEVKDQLEIAKQGDIAENIDIVTLAPRKADWDLKRDIERKLELLDRATQKAIAELIRDRLKNDEDSGFPIVNISEKS